MNKNRLEAFSDGVLAIIITIMVLEIKVPHGNTFNELKPLLPVFLSYLLSFIYVGIYWGNHHHLLHTVKKINSGMIWANLNLLFWLSLIPFSTGWMGEYHFSSHTVILYGINLLLCGASFGILQFNIERNTFDTEAMKYAFTRLKIKAYISTALYVLSIIFAMYYIILSQLLFVFVAVLWLIPDRHLEKALNNEQ